MNKSNDKILFFNQLFFTIGFVTLRFEKAK